MNANTGSSLTISFLGGLGAGRSSKSIRLPLPVSSLYLRP